MASWLSTLSPDYWSEIERVITGKPLEAKPGQIERSQRLFFLLKQVFGSSGKVSAVIRLYEASASPDQAQDGFELLRKISAEYALTTATEGQFFRNSVMSLKVDGKNKSVRDIVQSLEAEFFLYEKLINTITDSSIRNDLHLRPGEKHRLLLVNLDSDTRTYLQLHCPDEEYSTARTAALRYHDRTYMLRQDFSRVPHLSLSSVVQEDQSPGDPLSSLPTRPNSKAPAAKKDLSSVECWKCGRKGHYARDCRSTTPQRSNSQQNTPRNSQKGSPSKSSSNKGKGGNQKSKGGKGKKGLRAAEFSETEEVGNTETEQTVEAVSESEAWSEIGDGEEIRVSTFMMSSASSSSHTPQPFCHGRSSCVSCQLHGIPEVVNRSSSSCFADELKVLSSEKRFLQKPLQKRGFSRYGEPCVFLKRRVLPEKPYVSSVHLSSVQSCNSQLHSFCDAVIDIPEIRKIESGSKEECETCALHCPSVVQDDCETRALLCPSVIPGSPLQPSAESSSVGIHSSESCFEGILKSSGFEKILKSLGTFGKVAVSTKKIPLEDRSEHSFCSEKFSHCELQNSSIEVDKSELHFDSLQSSFDTSHCMSLHDSCDIDLHVDPSLHHGALCPPIDRAVSHSRSPRECEHQNNSIRVFK